MQIPYSCGINEGLFHVLVLTLPLAQCAGSSLQRPDISKALEKLNCSDTLVRTEFLCNDRPFDTKLVY